MNTINRNNYEEFFILYVDDELATSTKMEVETFVQQNADLALELEMLMQTKLKAEDFVFDNKEILLRTEGDNINETNYQEYFLLYIDNELSAAKRQEVETYILQHPKLQDEFTLLKQTIIPTENISYTNKEELYKYEKRRIVYLKPLRWVAAAVLIGLLGVGYWMFERSSSNVVTADVKQHQTQNKKQDQSTATDQSRQNTIAVKPVDSNLNIAHNEDADQTKTIAQQKTGAVENKTEAVTSIKQKKNIDIKKNDVVTAQQSSSTQEKAKHVKAIDENNIVKQAPQILDNHKNDVAINNNKNQLPITNSPSLNKKENIETVLPQTGENNDVANTNYKTYNVAYKEINPNNDDNSLHVAALDLNKTKVKTLLKKAGRLFGSKANKNANEDGKLQVANFEIQTNNL